MAVLKKAGAPLPSMKGWVNPYKNDPKSAERGEHLYQINCAQCHGKTGLGDGPVGKVTYVEPPQIGGKKMYPGLEDSYFYYYIYTGKNLMPTFGYRLSNQDICDIINHLRVLQSKN